MVVPQSFTDTNDSSSAIPLSIQYTNSTAKKIEIWHIGEQPKLLVLTSVVFDEYSIGLVQFVNVLLFNKNGHVNVSKDLSTEPATTTFTIPPNSERSFEVVTVTTPRPACIYELFVVI